MSAEGTNPPLSRRPPGAARAAPALRRLWAYSAIAALPPKQYTAYSLWFWAGIVLNAITTAIYVFFWRAVYAETSQIAGLNLEQTLTYILLAQVLAPLAATNLIFEFGYNLREGGIAHVLLRPLDFQATYYVYILAQTLMDLLFQIPLAVVATLLFGLRWPADPQVWGLFLVTAFLGRTALFFFDYILACLTFYTTEVWGLGVLVFGASLFFSGGLLPLVMMPGWMQALVQSLPFAQALYVPLALLSGIYPPEAAPRLWLVQLAWIAGLGLLSRWLFRRAVRKVTVQGG